MIGFLVVSSVRRLWKRSNRRGDLRRALALSCALVMFTYGCAGAPAVTFHDQEMDFSSIQIIAVMPLRNLTRETLAAERVRDTYITALLATGSIYVIPIGEVTRGVQRAAIGDPASPSPEEVAKFASIVKVDAVITGAVREYGEVRSGTTGANVISVELQMMEGKNGRVVWSSSSTKGGITMKDRLLGSGGEPMNIVTEQAINDLLNKFFK